MIIIVRQYVGAYFSLSLFNAPLKYNES